MHSYQAQKIVFRDTHAELITHSLPAPQANQVLIRSMLSLISPGTERAALTRVWDDVNFRANPGYALVGEAISVGENAAGLYIGQRVISLVGHASLALASTEPWVTLPVPDTVRDDEVVFIPLASVALHALRRAKLELGETLLVIGLGIIGQIAISLARLQGARQIIAMDLSTQRLELACQRGADQTINPTHEDPVSHIMALTGGEGAPVILDATGNIRLIPQTFKLTSIGGRIVTVGIIDEQAELHFFKEFQQRELTLIAANQPRCPITPTIRQPWTQQANRQYLLELMASNKLHVRDLITHRFLSSQAALAYEQVKGGGPEILGCLLDWSDSQNEAIR
jgi:2-desacetyl-2-hydroxyethyl bacteriochlorophyllide A dehydrogenase